MMRDDENELRVGWDGERVRVRMPPADGPFPFVNFELGTETLKLTVAIPRNALVTVDCQDANRRINLPNPCHAGIAPSGEYAAGGVPRPAPLRPSGGPCERCNAQGKVPNGLLFTIPCPDCDGRRWLTADDRERLASAKTGGA